MTDPLQRLVQVEMPYGKYQGRPIADLPGRLFPRHSPAVDARYRSSTASSAALGTPLPVMHE